MCETNRILKKRIFAFKGGIIPFFVLSTYEFGKNANSNLVGSKNMLFSIRLVSQLSEFAFFGA